MLWIAETTSEGWQPGIGDPTFMGWFTVLAYAMAAWLCWRAATRSAQLPQPQRTPATRLWIGLAALFVLLAINKQLDLQSWFTGFGREVARSEGWYEQRRTVQFIFIVALAIGGAATLCALAWMTRRAWRTAGLALIGTAFLITFIIIRAASFHHFDEVIGYELIGVRMNWVLELSGISCVAIAAWRAQRKPQITEARRVAGKVAAKPRPTTTPSAKDVESLRWLFDRSRR
jgi:hypothetical protein